jgi:hypothetical protein
MGASAHFTLKIAMCASNPDDSEGTPCRYGVPVTLDQHSLPPPAVKFAVKDPLPRAKMKAAVGHRNHRCASGPMICEVQPVSAARFRCALALSLCPG